MAIDLTGIELGPKMTACSERERKFVWAYCLNGGNGADAAREAGYSDIAEGAKVRAHEALQRDRVLEAIEECGRKHFRSLLVPALVARRRLIEKSDHADHHKAVSETLDALGLGGRTKVDINVSGEITVSHTDAAIQDLERMKAIGVPRAELERVFGFSGLERYERMLASKAKQIEGSVVTDGGAVPDRSAD